MGDQTHQAAEAYPDSSFMIIDYAYEEKDALPNLLGVVFKEQEAGYLVGYMAGLMTKSGTVSTVGARPSRRSTISSAASSRAPPTPSRTSSC